MRLMKTPILPLALAFITLIAATSHGHAAGASAKPAPSARHPDRAGTAERSNPQAELAAQGDAEAQYQLGLALLKKAGTGKTAASKLRSEGLLWLDLSAVRGNPHAALAAAREYEARGQILNASRMWYRAGQLGDAYARGRFVDWVLARKLDTLGGRDGAQWVTERVAATDARQGKVILGNAYRYGKGILPDTAQAQKWYLAAAMDGDVDAMVELGGLQLADPPQWRAPDKEIDRDGRHLPPSLWPVHWTARAKGGAGNLDLGREETAKALDVDPDRLILVRSGMVEGQSWLERAGRLKSAKALTVLAQAMTDGVTLPYDAQQGSLLRQFAACAGDAPALEALARESQIEVQGSPRHPVRAWVYWDLAASRGSDDAQAERDRIAKALSSRQLTRAKQISQDWCANPSQ